MRNLTKVLALVLALTMLVSVAAFAVSYTDVEADANYAEAVNVLSDLGLVKGYEDGTFGAEKTLTRAEGTAFVLRLMGLEEAAQSAAGSETGFSDVPADHWASGYVLTAAQNGVVAGMGDGTFEPDTELTYAQIVKMIVVALGYYPLASELGEWPGNYISAGSQIKLTTGIAGKADEAVTRGTTARLLYTALTIPKMEKKGIGVNATWEAGDTMILDDLSIYKIKGSVISVDEAAETVRLKVERQADAIDGKYVEKTTKHADWDQDLGVIANAGDTFGTVNVKTGDFAGVLRDMLSVPTVLYLSFDGDKYTVASVVEQKNKVETTIIMSDDIKEYNTTTDKLTYYTDEDQTKTATLKFDETGFSYRINGNDSTANFTAFKTAYIDTIVNGVELELKDTNGDGKIDYANVTAYEFVVVEDITSTKAGKYTFFNEIDVSNLGYAGKVVVDTDDDATIVTFVKDGEEIDIADVAEGDILNMVITEATGTTTKTLTKATIYVTNDTVEGTIKYNDTTDAAVTLDDGSSYGYHAGITGLTSQKEAVFYLTILGDIIYADTTNSQSAYEYGFATVINLDGREGNYSAGTIRVLTTEGKWVTLDLKSTLTVNNNTGVKIKDVARADNKFAANSAVYVAAADWALRDIEMVANKMVAYKLDSNGAVKALAIGNTNIEAVAGAETALINADKKFSAVEGEDSTLGAYNVNDTTVVYTYTAAMTATAAIAEEDMTVTDISVFVDGDSYGATDNIEVYAVSDSTNLAGVLFGKNLIAKIDWESNYFVVSKAVATTLGDDDVTMITGYLNGEEVVYYVDDDSEVKTITNLNNPANEIAMAATDVTTFNKGDIFVVSADAEGVISSAALITKATTISSASAFLTSPITALRGGKVKGDDDGYVIGGYVLGKNGSRIYLDTADTKLANNTRFDAGDETTYNTSGIFTVSNDTVVTVYDFTQAAKNQIYAGTAADVMRGTYVFGRADDSDRVKEVIVIINDLTETY